MARRSNLCELSQLDIDEQKLLWSFLGDGNIPLICVQSQGGGGYWVGVVTSTKMVSMYRAVAFGKGAPVVNSIFFSIVDGVSRKDISDSLIGIGCSSHSANANITFFDKEVADNFFTTLQTALNHSKELSNDSSANHLRELTQLHQDGLITNEEFDLKRKEIIGKL